MIIANKYEVPDKCPENCIFINDFAIYGQNAVCNYCPVFLCRESIRDNERASIVKPENYRQDWASEWSQWFKGDMKNVPVLKIQQLTARAYCEG